MTQPGHQNSTNRFLWISTGLAAILGFLLHHYTRWHPYLVAILSLSLVNFCFYGFDKARSKTTATRIPENLLHLISLLGGFPGGWLGRAVFRHKTRKGIFLAILLLSTALHAVLIYTCLI